MSTNPHEKPIQAVDDTRRRAEPTEEDAPMTKAELLQGWAGYLGGTSIVTIATFLFLRWQHHMHDFWGLEIGVFLVLIALGSLHYYFYRHDQAGNKLATCPPEEQHNARI